MSDRLAVGALFVGVALIAQCGFDVLGLEDDDSAQSTTVQVEAAEPGQASGTPKTQTSRAPQDKAKAKRPAQKRDLMAAGALGTKQGASHFTYMFPKGAENAGRGPARWNHCTPLRVIVNADDAPQGGLADVKTALVKFERATGLDVRYVGQTNRPVMEEWGKAERDGYDGWPPVHIGWKDLRGTEEAKTAAYAQPIARVNADGEGVIVSGQIVMNTYRQSWLKPGFGPAESRVSTILHELAHVVGLDHVEDERQLMHWSGSARDFGAGDLAGLKKVTSNCYETPAL